MPTCVCSNIRRASRVISRLYDAALAPCGLTVMQLETLDTLTDLGTASLSQLAAANAHERSAVWRGLQPLIKRGLVQLADPAGRADRYAVSEAGAELFQEAVERWRVVQARVLDQLGDDHAHLMAIVGKIDALEA